MAATIETYHGSRVGLAALQENLARERSSAKTGCGGGDRVGENGSQGQMSIVDGHRRQAVLATAIVETYWLLAGGP